MKTYPVLNLTVSDGVVDAVAGSAGGGQSLVTDEEVKVLGTSLA